MDQFQDGCLTPEEREIVERVAERELRKLLFGHSQSGQQPEEGQQAQPAAGGDAPDANPPVNARAIPPGVLLLSPLLSNFFMNSPQLGGNLS